MRRGVMSIHESIKHEGNQTASGKWRVAGQHISGDCYHHLMARPAIGRSAEGEFYFSNLTNRSVFAALGLCFQ